MFHHQEIVPQGSLPQSGVPKNALAVNKAFDASRHLPALRTATAVSRLRLDGAASRVIPFSRLEPVAAPLSQAQTQVQAQPLGDGVSVYRAFGKRALDLVCVILAAPFWVPLILIVAALIARDGHNPFYLQDRVGRGGRVFRMIKLRSMVVNADAKLEAHLAANAAARAEWDATQKLKADPRITAIGRFIRKTSIDELPQLINVLKGDMSLVGPRPFMKSQAPLYQGRGYFKLRPGLTGFWQVSDRNQCDFVARVGYDDAYESSLSFKTDLAILLRTVSVVARATGY